MGKKHKAEKQKHAPPPVAAEDAPPREPQELAHGASAEPQEETPAAPDAPAPAPVPEPPPRSRFRRLLPDIIKATVALIVIGLGTAIWLKPPLIRDTFPYVSYTFGGETFTNAVLHHPLSIPTRFYVGLPEMLGGRYQWFTVDRRREIAALADSPPQDSFLGWPAVRRDAPLGLDLEFRKLDGSEWRVFFFPDAIVFSNDILCVRLDTKPPKIISD